jgi:hypothetical protein
LLADSTKRDFTRNISLGSEIQVTRFLFTRFGFLTDNSSAPDATESASFIRPAKIDRYGFSASVGGFKNQKGLSAGVSMLFGKGTGNGLDLRNQALDSDEILTRVPVRERIIIISVGGDIGQAADVVKTKMKEKKSLQEIEAEQARELGERKQELEREEDPGMKAARQKAIEARKEAIEAEQRAREADEEVKRLERQKTQKENLDADDQAAIQGATQTGIETIR